MFNWVLDQSHIEHGQKGKSRPFSIWVVGLIWNWSFWLFSLGSSGLQVAVINSAVQCRLPDISDWQYELHLYGRTINRNECCSVLFWLLKLYTRYAYGPSLSVIYLSDMAIISHLHLYTVDYCALHMLRADSVFSSVSVCVCLHKITKTAGLKSM